MLPTEFLSVQGQLLIEYGAASPYLFIASDSHACCDLSYPSWEIRICLNVIGDDLERCSQLCRENINGTWYYRVGF